MSIKKQLAALLPALLLLSLLQAQLPAADSVVQAFRQAESQLILLKNEKQLIPLQRLDTLRIAVLSIGLPADGDFETILARYMPVQVEALSPDMGPEGLAAWLKRVQTAYNLIVIGINDYDTTALDPAYLPFEYPLSRLIRENRCAVAVFGEGEALQRMPLLGEASALMLTPLNEFSPSLAAQLVFGGVAASGKLSRDLNGAFPAGSGLSSPGGLRLRYSPPEVAGFNRQLLLDSVRTIVNEGIAKGAYPGAQVLVAKDGHVVFLESFGYHTYDSLQPVKPDDVYDFASLTKVTTGLPAVMKLAGEKRFDLDAPLARYYPYFRNSNKEDLTFRRVMTHSARLTAFIPFWRSSLKGNARYPWKKRWNGAIVNTGDYKCRTFRPDSSERYPVRITENLWQHRNYRTFVLKAIRKSPLNEKPGYVYSDLSFILWPEILPGLTGQPLEPYLKNTFYRPLGAYTLTFNAFRHFPMERIVPTENDTFFRMKQLQGTVHDEAAAMLGGISGHAGLFGSANDLAKLMQLYLNKGTYGGDRYIAAEAVEEFLRYQYPEENLRRGVGFDKPAFVYDPKVAYWARSSSPASFGHTGYTGTFTWADPNNGLLLIFFTNRVYPTRDNSRITELKLRPRLHQACYDAINPVH